MSRLADLVASWDDILAATGRYHKPYPRPRRRHRVYNPNVSKVFNTAIEGMSITKTQAPSMKPLDVVKMVEGLAHPNINIEPMI